MSVKKEESGRRSVQTEVIVPGTPEQVWQAIATGPGISSWFVPAKVDGKVGGETSCDFGGGMVSSAKITEWQPPLRFVAEDTTWLQGGPPVASEWTVEARDGGNCVVRVVHSLFASTDDWDDQLESTEHGWPGYFRVLRHYLEHYAGQKSATFVGMVPSGTPAAETWQKISAAIGSEPRVDGPLRIEAKGLAAITGNVNRIDDVPHGRSMTVHVDAPAPGVVMISAMDCMGMLVATMQAFYYGDRADAAAAEGDGWRQWLTALFPAQEAGGEAEAQQ